MTAINGDSAINVGDDLPNNWWGSDDVKFLAFHAAGASSVRVQWNAPSNGGGRDVLYYSSTDGTTWKYVNTIPWLTFEATGCNVSTEYIGLALKSPGVFTSSSYAVTSTGEGFNQIDTVLDTPLRNYAVLEANRLKAKNGNLVAYHDGEGGAAVTTIPLELNGKYYFEAITKQDQNVGAGIQNNLGSIGNPAGGVPSGLYAIFGYLTDGYYRYNGGTRSVIPGTTLATGDVLGVAVDMTTKEVTFFVNGSQVDTFTMSNTDDSQGYRFCAITGNSPGAEVPVNFGQQPFVYETARNEETGTVTVGGVEYQQLFTKYSLPAGPLTLEQYQGVQRAIDQFSVDVATRRTTLKAAKQAARTKLVALGLTEEEVTALALSLQSLNPLIHYIHIVHKYRVLVKYQDSISI